ncbi:MAG: 50S ribosomal protein L25 [Reyranella sp.]
MNYRATTRKTATRRLKAQGLIPGVCYGQGAEPLTVSVDPKLLVKSLDPVKKTNTVISMTVKGAPSGDQTLTVMVRDYQKDPIKGHLVHADFIRVSLDKEVHATVPVVLTGKAAGVVAGGILHQVIRILEIAALPDKIPVKIEVDVTPLNMGDAVHVRDLKLGEGVRPLVDPGTSVCSVTAPKAEKVEAVAEVPAEGAAAAPGAEGAAAAPAAAGGKPGEAAKGGAAPAAAGGKGAAPAKEGGGGKK